MDTEKQILLKGDSCEQTPSVNKAKLFHVDYDLCAIKQFLYKTMN